MAVAAQPSQTASASASTGEERTAGELGGIEETGALHDFIHVLAGYDATPIGEIEVFAFIAASMRGNWGLALLCFTLGIFQNDAIHSVDG